MSEIENKRPVAEEHSAAERAAQDDARCRAVEDALFRRACGYEVPLKKVFKVKRTEYDSMTGKKIYEREELETGIEEEHVQPDVRVCAYFLNNRAPDRWREHPQALGEAEAAGVVAFPPMAEAAPPPSTEEP